MREAGPVKAFEDVPIELNDPTRVVKIRTHLGLEEKWNLIKFLRTNSDIFACSHVDMCGISPDIVTYVLNMDPKAVPVRQKRRMLGRKGPSFSRRSAISYWLTASIKNPSIPNGYRISYL